eukprot:CAMPEP_0196570290 /NCGR_PEP_ID=MMETSP1081-20130531/308_1 /TAXON_ID=36882 /ORGANISM="Pyramimonas amylifera, Strain CCMP720" /LENGTH=79 /DNA_ID=CAMNT_0041886633 /DNA_START=89 /DNA_END=328 /DNA_ORIENTATION=+
MEARKLYRLLMKQAKNFPDYNIRGYIKRSTQDRFKESKGLTGEQATAALQKGLKDLEMVKRQSLIYGMYSGSLKSVMEA